MKVYVVTSKEIDGYGICTDRGVQAVLSDYESAEKFIYDRAGLHEVTGLTNGTYRFITALYTYFYSISEHKVV